MNIQLCECPEILQEEVQKSQERFEKDFGGSKIISVTLIESTPFKDKSIVSKNFRVIIQFLNCFEILEYSSELHLLGVSSDTVSIGAITDIIKAVPNEFNFLFNERSV